MIIPTTEKKSVVSLLLVGSLFMLTGCLGEKTKDVTVQDELSSHTGDVNKSEVLLSIDGKPVLYVDEFEDQKMMAQQTNQQLNMILQMMPDAEYSMLFKSIEAGHLMKAWVVREGLDKEAKFVKQMEQYIEAIKLQMYMRLYEDAHPINVTDHEAEAFYKAKRDQIPGLILTPAGVDVVYVNFATKAQAEAFAVKVKDGSEKHFKAAAKDASLKTESMIIGSDSAVNDALKHVVLATTKFPAKEIVKIDDNSYWVVGMLKKQDAQYRTFDTPEVKQGITKMCKDEKREVELTKQIENLMTDFNVVENKAYFDNKKQNQTKALSGIEKLVMQAQQSAQDDEGLDLSEADAILNDKI
ncbi:peptidyl-prolyl cis-trans isomerase [Candidatus Babeliales bacterium]|nr:peptidyl-prolyl cis-trans isomerase [Candidatus Babeliales bacterium]MBP9843318.1 peptidyl-prolyl cis-trans isomerase [Candidatus Babeliales bacterium]